MPSPPSTAEINAAAPPWDTSRVDLPGRARFVRIDGPEDRDDDEHGRKAAPDGRKAARDGLRRPAA